MAHGSVVADRVAEEYTSVISTTSACNSFQNTTRADLNAILEVMRKQLQSLQQDRTSIQKRIVVVRQTIHGLASVFGQNAIGKIPTNAIGARTRNGRGPGLTRTCSQLVRESSRALTVAELLELVQQKHPSLFEHNNNPQASLTTVLARLSQYGTVEAVFNEKGARAWQSTIQLNETRPSPLGGEAEPTSATQSAPETQRGGSWVRRAQSEGAVSHRPQETR
jgi:hypothetical protein